MGEYFLDNFSMPLSAGPSEMIKPTVEPFVHFRMNLEVMVTNLPRSLLFLHSLDLSSCSVFVSTANVKSVGSLKLFVSGEDISR